MQPNEQHGEFSTRGIGRWVVALRRAPSDHAGARKAAAVRALRGMPFRAPAAGLMVLAVILATGTDGLGSGRSGATPPVASDHSSHEPLDSTRRIFEKDPPRPMPEGDAGTVDEAVDEPVDEDIPVEEAPCIPERVRDLPDFGDLRVAYTEYLQHEERMSLMVRNLFEGPAVDVSGGCEASRPAFRDRWTLTYVVSEGMERAHREVVMAIDLRTGRRARITERTSLMAYSWDPEGTRLATVDQGTWSEEEGPGGSTIEILDTTDGSTVTIALPDNVEGRCGWLGDESALHWSPDGSMIALVMTGYDNDATLRVLDLTGRDLIAPRAGTMARWLDVNVLLYADNGMELESAAWHTVDVFTDTTAPSALRPETFEPAVSPHRSRVATFDEDGTLYIHTLANGRERVHRGLIHPRWIDARHVVATEVEPCSDECYYPFQETGRVSIVDVVDGTRTDLDIPPLWDAAFWKPAEHDDAS